MRVTHVITRLIVGGAQENTVGSVLGLRLNPDVRPGVVYLPKGIWNRHTKNGRVGTALVPDTISAVSGGACFNDARVEVGPA